MRRSTLAHLRLTYFFFGRGSLLEENDSGQSNLGHSNSRSGVCQPRRVGPENPGKIGSRRVEREGWFAPIFALSVSLWGSSRGIFGGVGSTGALNCARLEFSGCRETLVALRQRVRSFFHCLVSVSSLTQFPNVISVGRNRVWPIRFFGQSDFGQNLCLCCMKRFAFIVFEK